METRVGLQQLEGVWELTHTHLEGTQYVQTIDARGWVERSVRLYCDRGPEYQRYLELEPTAENRWEGDSVYVRANPETGETEELDRRPIVVGLSDNGQVMTESSPDYDDVSVYERVAGSRSEGFVTLQVANASTKDMANLYLADASGGTRFDADENRWGTLRSRLESFLGHPGVDPHENRVRGLVEAGTSCWMTLPPGVYHLRAEDSDRNPVATEEAVEVHRDTTWTITD